MSHRARYWSINLLFYINDIPNTMLTTVRLFAGDTIIYSTMDKSDQLQKDLQQLGLWVAAANTEFHLSKCEVDSVERKNRPHPATTSSTTKPSLQLKPSSIQDNLKWQSHTDYTTGKALGFHKRTVLSELAQIGYPCPYKQLIKPVVEYAL